MKRCVQTNHRLLGEGVPSASQGPTKSIRCKQLALQILDELGCSFPLSGQGITALFQAGSERSLRAKCNSLPRASLGGRARDRWGVALLRARRERTPS